MGTHEMTEQITALIAKAGRLDGLLLGLIALEFGLLMFMILGRRQRPERVESEHGPNAAAGEDESHD